MFRVQGSGVGLRFTVQGFRALGTFVRLRTAVQRL